MRSVIRGARFFAVFCFIKESISPSSESLEIIIVVKVNDDPPRGEVLELVDGCDGGGMRGPGWSRQCAAAWDGRSARSDLADAVMAVVAHGYGHSGDPVLGAA